MHMISSDLIDISALDLTVISDLHVWNLVPDTTTTTPNLILPLYFLSQ